MAGVLNELNCEAVMARVVLEMTPSVGVVMLVKGACSDHVTILTTTMARFLRWTAPSRRRILAIRWWLPLAWKKGRQFDLTSRATPVYAITYREASDLARTVQRPEHKCKRQQTAIGDSAQGNGSRPT